MNNKFFSCVEKKRMKHLLFGSEHSLNLCQNEDVKIIWHGYHNLVESATETCNSHVLNTIVSEYHKPNYEQTFTDLGTTKGATRFFRCGRHCTSKQAYFQVFCADPSPPLHPSPSPPPPDPKYTEMAQDVTENVVDGWGNLLSGFIGKLTRNF